MLLLQINRVGHRERFITNAITIQGIDTKQQVKWNKHREAVDTMQAILCTSINPSPHNALNFPDAWRSTTRRFLGHRVAAPETEIPNALDQVAANGIYGALRGKQGRALSGRFLHPEEPNRGTVPDTDSAWGSARGRTNDHFAGEDKAPEERFIPAH
jgi:hypothetical protein